MAIPKKLQKYAVKWYHKYPFHPVLYQTEAMIRQHFYWKGLKEAVQKEVTFCDTCQRTKRSIKKYGKLSAKLAEETPWNKPCVDIIGPYKILRKGKEYLILKSVTIIYPITR